MSLIKPTPLLIDWSYRTKLQLLGIGDHRYGGFLLVDRQCEVELAGGESVTIGASQVSFININAQN